MSFDGEKGMSWGQEGCGNDKLLQEEKAGPGLSVWGGSKGKEPNRRNEKTERTVYRWLWFDIIFIVENFCELLCSFTTLFVYIINCISLHMFTYQEAQEFN